MNPNVSIQVPIFSTGGNFAPIPKDFLEMSKGIFLFSQLRGRRKRDGGRWYYEVLGGKAKDADKYW